MNGPSAGIFSILQISYKTSPGQAARGEISLSFDGHVAVLLHLLLILLRDIVEDKDTLVRREFKPFLTEEDEKNICCGQAFL